MEFVLIVVIQTGINACDSGAMVFLLNMLMCLLLLQQRYFSKMRMTEGVTISLRFTVVMESSL